MADDLQDALFCGSVNVIMRAVMLFCSSTPSAEYLRKATRSSREPTGTDSEDRLKAQRKGCIRSRQLPSFVVTSAPHAFVQMKFLATFFTLAAIQTGVLAIYQPESGSTPWLYSKNERCKQALEHLSRSFLPLQANLNPEVLIARGNQQQQSNQARTALIEGAYESSQQAVQEFMRTTWGPLTDAQHKQQLTAAINQMVSSLQAVTRGCVGDCGGVVEVLQLAKNVQTAKQQMYTDCNVELPPEQNKKAEFKFSRFKISRSKK